MGIFKRFLESMQTSYAQVAEEVEEKECKKS